METYHPGKGEDPNFNDRPSFHVQPVIFVPTLGLQLETFAEHYAPLLSRHNAVFEPVITPFIDLSRQRICQLAHDRNYPYALMLDDDVLLSDKAFSQFLNPSLPVELIAYPFKGDRTKVTSGDFSHPDLPLHTFPSFDLFNLVPEADEYFVQSQWCGAGAMAIRHDWLHTAIFFEQSKLPSPFTPAPFIRYGEDVTYCMFMSLLAPSLFWQEYERKAAQLLSIYDIPRLNRYFLSRYYSDVQHLDRYDDAGTLQHLSKGRS